MKILYFGTVCEMSEYEKILSDCKTKPSVASVVFESALLKGMKLNNADVTVYSFPMIPVYPNSKKLYWGNKVQQLASGYTCTWLKTINIPFLKQLSRKMNARKILKTWLDNNKHEKCIVLTYSIPPFFAKDVLCLCKKYNTKCYAIVADLLRDMYMNHQKSKIVSWMQNQYINPTLAIQGDFDGYVYLTELMSDVINPEKPYVVMEGIADISNVEIIEEKSDTDIIAIMYAGGLYEKYGILNLLDAFEKLEMPELRLWLFGEGSAVETIKERALGNSKIKYMGCLSREEILLYERKANILVNPRNVDEEFTKYSFPSKIIEYMLSGTPLLTTRLRGIPQEYFDYVFTADNNDTNTLINALKNILRLSEEQRKLIGKAAREFIVTNKNAEAQAKIVLDFIGCQEK